MVKINIIQELFTNRMLWTAVLAWFLAQLIKLIIDIIKTGELDLHLIFESGGMPSSHSATICSICVSIGKDQGFNSPLFALAFVIAMIVMYDATGVRRATGEQGRVLVKMINLMQLRDHFQNTVKEVLGHKPQEVLVGALLGILTGAVFG